jgi:protein-S-isoprenylcysteine O-methyltransferase Ste14
MWAWGAWALTWWIAALWANRTQARPSLMSELPYRVVTLMGAALLFIPRLRGLRLWMTPPPVRWGLVALAAAGFAFCWSARIYLGRLWSGSVTRKSDHRIVDTGPYALVRHPIYTGLILAAAATAALKGSAGALAGFALLTLGCWIKARLEERFLSAELGAEAYDAYRRRTGMLFPGL